MERPTDPKTPDSGTSADNPKSRIAETGPQSETTVAGAASPQCVIIRQHSAIIYWWPVWVVGFLFAGLSFAFGQRVEVGDQQMWFHPSRNLGVIYLAVFAVVFLRTNVTLRGVVSLLVILAVIVGVLLFSLLGGWRRIFSLEQHISVHMDAGFYLAISTIVFLCWALTVFLFDRMTYCVFRPGQLVVHKLIGGGVRTFDTRGISVYKLQDDLFRHWGLGLGTGDLHVATTGAEGVTLDLRNVTLIDRKLASISQLVAMSPDGPAETHQST